MTRFVVTACEGREDVTAETVRELMCRGGGQHLESVPTLHWAGQRFNISPHEMNVHLWSREPDESTRATYWRTLRTAYNEHPNEDLVVIEDDVQPARNALLYIERWVSPHVTTFYNTRGYKVPGTRRVDFSGHWGTQCMYYPNSILRQLVKEDPDSRDWLKNPSNPRLLHQGRHGGDVVLGFMLFAWGLEVFHHRSIVQHVGETSLCDPSGTLKGIRVARDFVGADFDCMELLK